MQGEVNSNIILVYTLAILITVGLMAFIAHLFFKKKGNGAGRKTFKTNAEFFKGLIKMQTSVVEENHGDTQNTQLTTSQSRLADEYILPAAIPAIATSTSSKPTLAPALESLHAASTNAHNELSNAIKGASPIHIQKLVWNAVENTLGSFRDDKTVAMQLMSLN